MPRIRVLLLVLLGIGVAPGLARAKGFGHHSSGGHSSSPSSSSGSHNAAPNGTPHHAQPGSSYGGSYGGGYRGGQSYYTGGRYYSPGYVYGPSYSYGWGVHPWGYYGWGYYPYYGGPVVVNEYQPAPPPVTSSLFVGGLFTRDGAGLSLTMGVDGKHWGANFDLLTLPSVNPVDSSDVTNMPLLKGHLTYAIYSDLHARLRLEGGIGGIAAPDVTYIGPDLGVSGQLALVGPLAVEAGAHWMPVPASIVDLNAGVGLNFGALAIKGGWRWVRLDDRRVNDQGGGVDLFNGPMISLGVLF